MRDLKFWRGVLPLEGQAGVCSGRAVPAPAQLFFSTNVRTAPLRTTRQTGAYTRVAAVYPIELHELPSAASLWLSCFSRILHCISYRLLSEAAPAEKPWPTLHHPRLAVSPSMRTSTTPTIPPQPPPYPPPPSSTAKAPPSPTPPPRRPRSQLTQRFASSPRAARSPPGQRPKPPFPSRYPSRRQHPYPRPHQQRQ